MEVSSFLVMVARGAAVSALLLGCAVESELEQRSQALVDPPNILLVIADDVGLSEIGAYEGEEMSGATPWKTPRIDGLAAAGVRFDRAWSNPVCSPTRATIYTGQYSARTGIGAVVRDDGSTNELEESDDTIAEAVSGAGYETALFGKWHLGQSAGDAAPCTIGGFDHFAGSLGGALTDYSSWERVVCDGAVTTSATSADYATSVNVDDALDWIGKRAGPWFATVAFNAAHSPYHVPPDDLQTRELLASCTNKRRCFQVMIEAMDTEIGRLLDGFDTSNTWVIFVGDNGTASAVADRDIAAKGWKGTVYEGGLRVPLVISGPGALTTEVDDLVNTTDLFATIADLADSPATATDARSLVAYVEGGVPAPRETVYAETFSGDDPHGASGRVALRDDTYKIVEKGGVLTECFLTSDESESTNVLADPAHSGACTALWNDFMEPYHTP